MTMEMLGSGRQIIGTCWGQGVKSLGRPVAMGHDSMNGPTILDASFDRLFDKKKVRLSFSLPIGIVSLFASAMRHGVFHPHTTAAPLLLLRAPALLLLLRTPRLAAPAPLPDPPDCNIQPRHIRPRLTLPRSGPTSIATRLSFRPRFAQNG
jgi:hypothetical protein